jgi:Fur family ferric uptake transcriptional regulator/Fur family peroxide stress response transcriptional regulator
MTIATDQDLSTALRERGQRVTSQRLLIHRALRELDTHVTAEELLATVADRLPGVSLPTVYATLDLLERLGAARRINAGGAVLYEAGDHEHQHFVCERCGRVEDLHSGVGARAALQAARNRGFAPHRADLLVRGLCDDCV